MVASSEDSGSVDRRIPIDGDKRSFWRKPLTTAQTFIAVGSKWFVRNGAANLSGGSFAERSRSVFMFLRDQQFPQRVNVASEYSQRNVAFKASLACITTTN